MAGDVWAQGDVYEPYIGRRSRLVAARELDPAAADLEEGVRFPLCHSDPLRTLFEGAGRPGVAVDPVDVPTRFRDFDD